jgi:hypothetical protein
LWKFAVPFVNTNTTASLSAPVPVPVAAFSPACSGGTCIPQGGVKQKLDSLGDRLMYRLVYRNFGGYESMVVNHSVNTTSSSGNCAVVGVRWYELRNPPSGNLSTVSAMNLPTVYQQGTYAPDCNYRWMGSIAMDEVGNIAVGYSGSSSSTHPFISITERAPTDQPLGALSPETQLLVGGGSQTRYSRWGDYSAMALDPDGCTFYYTNEFIPSNGVFNWDTQIYPFKLPGCQ